MYKNQKQNKDFKQYKEIFDVKKIFYNLDKEIEILQRKVLLLYVKKYK